MANILVVDDELGIRDLLTEILNDEGHTVEAAENAFAARQVRLHFQPDLILLDIWMPDMDGVSLLKEWMMAGTLTAPVVMMSGHATIDTAVEATRIGAHSFLEKPITMHKLLKTVSDALSVPRLSARPYAAEASKINVGALPTTGGFMRSGDLTVEAAMNGGQQFNPVAISTPLSVITADQKFQLDKPLREARDEFEKAYFEYHLSKEGGSMTRVADKTGLERTHLYRKLKQLGVDISRAKQNS